MPNLYVLFLCVLLVAKVTWSANILYLATTASPSHTIWDKTLAMALREKHQITFFSHEAADNIENFTSIVMEGIYEKLGAEFSLEEMADNSKKVQVELLFHWMNLQSTFDAETEGLQKLIKKIDEGYKYDLIIWDMTTGHYLYPLIEKLNYPPVIATSAFGLPLLYTFEFGIDLHTAYIPMWVLTSTDQMTFYERTQNLFLSVYALYMRQFWYYPRERQISEKVFGKNIPSFDKMEKKISILLSNSDPIFDFPVPVPPAVIQVGGLHIKRLEKLPKDLETYLNNSKHGVILFSLGTNLRSDKLGIKQKEALLNGFSKLKQNVLWKFESPLENLPKNVMIKKWLPQNEILAHPNVKLFISHGGCLSTQEAMSHGVPVIGMPFFADQSAIIHKIISKKLGLELKYNSLTADLLYETINEVLSNPIYRKNMQSVSKRYKDQPQNPLDRALFWVEYILRHGGGEHLKIAARDMSYIKLHLLDIWATIIGILLLVLYIIIKLLNGKSKEKTIKNKSKIQ